MVGFDIGLDEFTNIVIEASNTLPGFNEEIIHIVVEGGDILVLTIRTIINYYMILNGDLIEIF